MPVRRSSLAVRDLRDSPQADLFSFADAPPVLPPGMAYQPNFLSAVEERHWLAVVGGLPLVEVSSKAHTVPRRMVSYGVDVDVGRTDDGDGEGEAVLPTVPMPAVLEPLRHRVAGWLRIGPDRLVQTVVEQQGAGSSTGWQRDLPEFDLMASVSLGHPALLRLKANRPGGVNTAPAGRRNLSLQVAPRSIYRLAGDARRTWQHNILPTAGACWSVTFRTVSVR